MNFWENYFSSLSKIFRPILTIFLISILFGSNAYGEIVQHSGVISAQTTWLATDVHRVTGTVTVNAGVQLTIEPGAVVKFNPNTSLSINGALTAEGNAS